MIMESFRFRPANISRNIAVALMAAVAVMQPAGPALAHHSFAAFDRSKPLQVTGTIKEYRWTNPHTWLYVVVRAPNNQTLEYAFEGFSPVLLPRFGITRDKFKPGDLVTVTYFGRRDGTLGGQYTAIAPASADHPK